MARQEGFPRDTPRPSAPGAATPGVTEKAQDVASQVVDKAQETAGRVADKVQQTAAPVVDQASEKAGQVAEKATEQVSSRLDMGKDYAADALTGVAQALRQTGQHLREEGSQPMLGQYADSGAQQLERFTGYLRQHDTDDLIADVESFARRSPTVFAGGAFALGLLAARFFRSSGQPRQPSSPTRPGMPSGYRPPTSRPPVAPPSARPATPGPTPRPAANQPPSYAGGAPAARTAPASSDWMPGERSTSGGGMTGTGREAERTTPVPGAMPPTGTPPLPGASPRSGTSSPTPNANPSTGTTPPSPGGPGPTTRPPV